MASKHSRVLQAEAAIAAATKPPEAPAVAPVAAPSPAPAAPAKVTALPERTPEQELAYLRQRVSTFDGVMRKRDQEHADELRQLSDRLQVVTDEKAKLAQDLERALAAAPVDLSARYPDAVRAEIGEEELGRLDKVVTAAVAQATKSVVAPLEQQLAEQRKQQAQEREQSAREREQASAQAFDDAVEKAIPGWQGWAVGDAADSRFIAWLDSKDPSSGLVRRDLLIGARNRRDADTFLHNLNVFLESLGARNPPPPSNRSLPQGNAGGSDAPLPPADDFMSLSEIEQFANDVNRGMYRNRPQEMRAKQAQIDAALRAQKVRR
jgi:hypothetical protein